MLDCDLSMIEFCGNDRFAADETESTARVGAMKFKHDSVYGSPTVQRFLQ